MGVDGAVELLMFKIDGSGAFPELPAQEARKTSMTSTLNNRIGFVRTLRETKDIRSSPRKMSTSSMFSGGFIQLRRKLPSSKGAKGRERPSAEGNLRFAQLYLVNTQAGLAGR
jgi:hypothetical protein